VQSYVYELPFGPRKRWAQSGVSRWVLGDWQLNGIFSSMTGLPLNVTFSGATLNAPGNNNRPNLNGKPEIFGAVGPGQKWLDVTMFSAPAPATFGTAGRNILNGPGVVNLDLSMFRNIPVREGMNLQLRVESFNLTNTPQFDRPNSVFGSAGFGEVTTARGTQSSAENFARQFQLGLRLIF
jgi:hypothetical protein